MTPIGSATTGTAWFLNGLANLQQQETQTQRELSSGYQINDAADSPSQTPELIQLGSTSRRGAGLPDKPEQRADGSRYGGPGDRVGGITLIQSADTLATQGASSTASAATDQTLATRVQSIQQQLVAIANTTVAGRSIFGGDQDQSPPYQYDAAQRDGRRQPHVCRPHSRTDRQYPGADRLSAADRAADFRSGRRRPAHPRRITRLPRCNPWSRRCRRTISRESRTR